MMVTEESLIAAVREALNVSDDENALTRQELCKALSLRDTQAWRALKLLVNEGVVECVKVRRINITGFPQKLPGYRIKATSDA